MKHTPALILLPCPNPGEKTHKFAYQLQAKPYDQGIPKKSREKRILGGTYSNGGERRKIGTMVGAGSETVSAITLDCGVGRGNGFGQEMGNPIFGPFGGVDAER